MIISSADSRTPLSAVAGILGICLLMTATSLVDGLVATTPMPLSSLLWKIVPRWTLFAVTLPVVLHVTLTRPPWPLRFGTMLLHACMFLGVATSHAIVHALITGTLVPPAFAIDQDVVRLWVASLTLTIPLYAAILLTAASIEQGRERRARAIRSSQLEAQLQTARLTALRSQLSPHFLYNALNGISALVNDREHQRASHAIEQLAELLHAAFRDDQSEQITLAADMELTHRYLALQQLRFGHRLQYDVTCSPAVGGILVPTLLLQPLVENAVVHGLKSRRTPMDLRVEAKEDNETILITVTQDGPDLPADWVPSTRTGVGLANTRARLATAFGSSAQLTLRPRDGGGLVASIRIARNGSGHDSSAPTRVALPGN